MALGSSRPRSGNKETWLTKIGMLLLDEGKSLDEATAEMARLRRLRLDDVKAELSRLHNQRIERAEK